MTIFAALLTIALVTLPSSLAQTECVTETADLVANTAVSGAFGTMQAVVDTAINSEGIGDFCPREGLGCVVDFSEYYGDYTAACETAGGTVVTREVEFVCRKSVFGVTIPLGYTVAVRNIPTCIASSCDTVNFPKAVEVVVDTAIEVAAEGVELAITSASGLDLECDGELNAIDGPSPTGSGGGASGNEATTPAPVSTTATPVDVTTPAPTPSSDELASAPPVEGAEATETSSSSVVATSLTGFFVTVTLLVLADV